MTAARETAGLEASIRVGRGDFSLEIDLAIPPGRTVALLGPNGAGKSTTVDALAGSLPIDGGRIELAGRVLDDPRNGVFVPTEHRRIGVVFQRYLLFEHMDVVDNVAFGPCAAGLSRRAAREAARPWIELFGLEGLASQRPPELSGGQAQRVALARALAAEPDALLLDEPLAALDVASRTQLRRTLRAHVGDYRGPRLVITHDPADAFLLADEIAVLEHGRITQLGSPDDIRRRPATAYVAALAGVNLLTGTSDLGSLTIDGSSQALQASDTTLVGPVLVTIHPTAVALFRDEPHGSPRNSWPTRIATIEPLGDITRVTVEAPLPLSADVTPASVEGLGLAVGGEVWVSIKATEISLSPT